jgi:hypothetical protein
MPRRAHLDASGTLHRIIVRGIERRRIFSEFLIDSKKLKAMRKTGFLFLLF